VAVYAESEAKHSKTAQQTTRMCRGDDNFRILRRIREWCRLQRIHVTKRPTDRGDALEWEIATEEIQRIREHGLLPIPERY